MDVGWFRFHGLESTWDALFYRTETLYYFNYQLEASKYIENPNKDLTFILRNLWTGAGDMLQIHCGSSRGDSPPRVTGYFLLGVDFECAVSRKVSVNSLNLVICY